jgi:hypothetical protein
MKVLDEVTSRRFAQLALAEERVDTLLDTDVGSRFDLKIPAAASIQVVSQRPLDVSRSCVMAFDQVAVVAVHDRDQLPQASSSPRMKSCAQFARSLGQLHYGVGQR